MFVAAFFAHAGDPFGRREKALLFLTVFAALAFTGGGRYTIESLFRRGAVAKR